MIVVILIVYGSLYPFDFAVPGPESWGALLDFPLLKAQPPGDILGNIGLFIPLGVLSGLIGISERSHRLRFIMMLVAGVALALLLQVFQVFVPSRTPAIADVIWNASGLAIGALFAWFLKEKGLFTYGQVHAVSASFVMVIVWVLSELIPLVPSIDLQQFKDSLKPLLLVPEVSLGDTLLACAAGLILGEIISVGWGVRRSLLRLIFALVLMFFAKILVVKVDVDLSLLLGWSAAIGGRLVLASRFRSDRRTLIAMWALAAVFVAALEPFAFASSVSSLHVLPFSSFLEGSMLSNVQALAQKIFLYAGILWLVLPRVHNILSVAIALACLVFVLELFQMLLVGRVASIDEPILVLGLGVLFKQFSDHRIAFRLTESTPRPADLRFAVADERFRAERSKVRDVRWKSYCVVLLFTAVFIGFGISWLLRFPRLPYNIEELFLGGGNILFFSIFGLAVLSIGVGGYWVGWKTAGSGHPGLMLPVAGIFASIMTLVLLNGSVTAESINDIVGSSNVYWYVTNKDMWGAWARDVFLIVGPGAVSAIERSVRFAALYGPLVAFLGLGVAICLRLNASEANWRWAMSIIAGLFVWLLFCKLIAFDWSSTDNLNELIARPGRFGIGGGGYLYALLALAAVNALLPLIVDPVGRRLVIALLGTAFAVPLGWLLLNEGLEQAVQKYGIVFSGVQFLFGPDRQSTMPNEALFQRWALVYISFVAVAAMGIWIGRGIFGLTQCPADPEPVSASQAPSASQPRP